MKDRGYIKVNDDNRKRFDLNSTSLDDMIEAADLSKDVSVASLHLKSAHNRVNTEVINSGR